MTLRELVARVRQLEHENWELRQELSDSRRKLRAARATIGHLRHPRKPKHWSSGLTEAEISDRRGQHHRVLQRIRDIK
jgi:hypothetical protein